MPVAFTDCQQDPHAEVNTRGGNHFEPRRDGEIFRWLSISEVLELTVDDGCEFFQNQPRIHQKLQTLADVGLGYIHLGQSATTLSGGEAQRVKLATAVSKRDTGRTIYIFG